MDLKWVSKPATESTAVLRPFGVTTRNLSGGFAGTLRAKEILAFTTQ